MGTDMGNRLAIPEGQSHVLVPFMDQAGRVWNFRFSNRVEGHPKPTISSEAWINFVEKKQLGNGDKIIFYEENGVWKLRVSKRRDGPPKPVFSSEDDDDKNGGGGDDDGNNGGGGCGGSGGNREGDYNGDKDKRSRDGGGGDVTGKNMDSMGGAFFGYKFGYHAGYENGYPVGQFKCVQVVQ